MKLDNKTYSISWSIIGSFSPYTGRGTKCNLCIAEKFFILHYNDQTKQLLNHRDELINKCRHTNKYLLKYFKTWHVINLSKLIIKFIIIIFNVICFIYLLYILFVMYFNLVLSEDRNKRETSSNRIPEFVFAFFFFQCEVWWEKHMWIFSNFFIVGIHEGHAPKVLYRIQ